MLFDYKYLGNSTVTTTGSLSDISFVPDASRSEAVSFKGELIPEHAVRFREAISALHDVVINDQRFVPKDRSAYLAWRKAEDEKQLTLYQAESKLLQEQIQASTERIFAIEQKLQDARRSSGTRNQAIRKYYDYLYTANRDAWFVLDPVITVHPKDIFFECFSRDESSYGKLTCDYSLFTDESISQKKNGTTNIDYSDTLYNEFQKIRDYRTTKLEVDPEGFNLKTTGEDDYREVKIELPDSWIRGFLQVSAAMTLPAAKIRLHPQDIFMLCQVLRQRKDTAGTRAIQFHVKPNQHVRIVLEPWNIEIVCERSTYFGDTEQKIRVWGRRRFHMLERLISVAKHFDLYLMGVGMPYFFVADLYGMHFTLGLSGWSKNNFSDGSNFALLAPRGDVDDDTKERVFKALKMGWSLPASKIARVLKLTEETVRSALMAYIQAGRVVYDIHKDTYQARELSRDPLDMSTLRFSSPEEEQAMVFLSQEAISQFQTNEITSEVNGKQKKEHSISGHVQDGDTEHISRLVLDENGCTNRMESDCTCDLGRRAFRSGLCRHVLALRLELQNRFERGFSL